MSDTGWRVEGKPELLFGRMFEDPDVELSAFPAGSRVFAIASAGCTPIELANAGYKVVAVDLNPAQTAYVAERLKGAEPRAGKIDGWLRGGLRIAPWLGMSGADRKRFCAMTDTGEQVRFWRRYLATRRLRGVLRGLVHPAVLGRVYSAQILNALPDRFDQEVLKRLEAGFAIYPNAENPFVRGYLLGEKSPVRFRSGAIEVVTMGAAEYLERQPAGSFDAFTLSNIFDGAGDLYAERLLQAVAKAAAPGAVKVIRRFAGNGSLDRSLVWGAVEITQA